MQSIRVHFEFQYIMFFDTNIFSEHVQFSGGKYRKRNIIIRRVNCNILIKAASKNLYFLLHRLSLFLINMQ